MAIKGENYFDKTSEETRVIQAIRRTCCQANNDYLTLDQKELNIIVRFRKRHNKLHKYVLGIRVLHPTMFMRIERTECITGAAEV